MSIREQAQAAALAERQLAVTSTRIKNAALEAMAAYTPVISSNAGGIPEVNIQGETGYLAEIGNVEAMSNYAIKILSNEELLLKMKHNAHEQAERFDLKNILPIYENMYQKTLENFKKHRL